jgi:hypothetical protein
MLPARLVRVLPHIKTARADVMCSVQFAVSRIPTVKKRK